MLQGQGGWPDDGCEELQAETPAANGGPGCLGGQGGLSWGAVCEVEGPGVRLEEEGRQHSQQGPVESSEFTLRAVEAVGRL